MPQIQSQHPDQLDDPPGPESISTSETLFLLSICRDEDDAAALRSDLKRSGLGNYKFQRCVHLDDATQLLQVCGFDLAFLRLDDFEDPSAAIELIRQNDPKLALVALASNRLLNSEGFQLPAGLDGHCRLEDISPTLISNLVSSVLEQKRERQERLRLSQELNFALEIGELGSWSLDIETGRMVLSEQASQTLGRGNPEQIPFLDDFLEIACPADQDDLKRQFDISIETQGDLEASFRVPNGDKTGSSLLISAIYRPGGPRTHPTLKGLIKRESNSSDEIQSRIEAASEAIRKAFALRDDAFATASKELESLAQKMSPVEQRLLETLQAPSQEALVHASPAATVSAPANSTPAPEIEAKEEPAVRSGALEKTKTESTLHPLTSIPSVAPTPKTAPAEAKDNQTLGIDKSHALQQVLKSITRQKGGATEAAFPFDFSTEAVSDYTEPNPQKDGFVGAAKRFVDITQAGHDIAVTLSVENDGAIESEQERELLFEILKELLTNVVKHARASECIIALFRDEDDWVLQVEDDGVGLENNLVSISTPLNKIGLFRIRTKLALKGGQLDLTPTFPKGLIARARIPVSLMNRGAERA